MSNHTQEQAVAASTVHSTGMRWIASPQVMLAAVVAIGGIALPVAADLVLSKTATAPAQCSVSQVIDGDTVHMDCPGRGSERARLTGFDTPELFAPQCASEFQQAQAAKQHLQTILAGAQDIALQREGTDRYGRALMTLWLDGEPAAARMIEDGHARAYAGGRRDGWCTSGA